jgi:hypothetical protein
MVLIARLVWLADLRHFVAPPTFGGGLNGKCNSLDVFSPVLSGNNRYWP